MHALEIRQLCKTYHGGVVALKGISFEVAQGDFFALLGPNGAGKSTTIGIISSLVNKDSGTIHIFGHDFDRHRDLVKTYIGLMPQEFNFNVFEKVLAIVVNQAGYYGIRHQIAMERAEYLLKKLDLWHKRNTVSRNLSGGMKRKLMLVRALIHEPQLLILDEPTAGVDVETRREMWDFLRDLHRRGTTIILTTHYLEEAEQQCHNIAIINNGAIIENTSIKKLIATLDRETFIIDLQKPLTQLAIPEGYNVEKLDDLSLKLEISRQQSLNEIILHLHEQNIEIMSLRNASNRLEELFIRLTKKQKHESNGKLHSIHHDRK